MTRKPKLPKTPADQVMLDDLADVMRPGTMRVGSDFFRTVDPFDPDQVWVHGAVLSLIPKPFAGESLPRFWGVGVLPPVGGPGTSAVVVHPQMRRGEMGGGSVLDHAPASRDAPPAHQLRQGETRAGFPQRVPRVSQRSVVPPRPSSSNEPWTVNSPASRRPFKRSAPPHSASRRRLRRLRARSRRRRMI
ncbi:MAG: hypothetical protein LBE08_04095 [Bifidobacteriaceae bacterium]|nr:hypothetical protein [Bifidobacteriaceae bacterium]